MTDRAEERARQQAIDIINDFNCSFAGYIPPTAIPTITQAIRDAVAEAKAEEREACADIAESYCGFQSPPHSWPVRIAAAIRARKEP